jgi:hypothetical protein
MLNNENSINAIEIENTSIIKNFLNVCLCFNVFLFIFTTLFKFWLLLIISLSSFFILTFSKHLLERKKYWQSQLLSLLFTNISILSFSFFLGFRSGWFFYILVAPVVAHLFFKFGDTKIYKIALGIYFASFLILYIWFMVLKNSSFYYLNEDLENIILILNFCGAFFVIML